MSEKEPALASELAPEASALELEAEPDFPATEFASELDRPELELYPHESNPVPKEDEPDEPEESELDDAEPEKPRFPELPTFPELPAFSEYAEPDTEPDPGEEAVTETATGPGPVAKAAEATAAPGELADAETETELSLPGICATTTFGPEPGLETAAERTALPPPLLELEPIVLATYGTGATTTGAVGMEPEPALGLVAINNEDFLVCKAMEGEAEVAATDTSEPSPAAGLP